MPKCVLSFFLLRLSLCPRFACRLFFLSLSIEYSSATATTGAIMLMCTHTHSHTRMPHTCVHSYWQMEVLVLRHKSQSNHIKNLDRIRRKISTLFGRFERVWKINGFKINWYIYLRMGTHMSVCVYVQSFQRCAISHVSALTFNWPFKMTWIISMEIKSPNRKYAIKRNAIQTRICMESEWQDRWRTTNWSHHFVKSNI